MDATRTAISLFGFIVNAFNSLQLARNFEDDFAQHQIKLDIMQLRFLRWGEIAKIATIDETQRDALDLVKTALSNIQHSLRKAQEESQKVGKKTQKDAQTTESLDPELCLAEDFKRIRNRLKAACQKHKVQAYTVIESVKWVIYKKESFDQLLENVSSLMDRLESIADVDHGKLRKLCDEDCKGLSKLDLEKLDLAITGCDPLLESAISDTLRSEDGRTSVVMSHNTGHVTGIHNGDNRRLFLWR
ncbi:prion-inhibition and propagation-domain-containing protein [Xylaria cubensis]|nr:prion-inhibition and propagation-domain-containing protein [Xylaria cubensis]